MWRLIVAISIAACDGNGSMKNVGDDAAVKDAQPDDAHPHDAAPTSAFCMSPPVPTGATYYIAPGGSDGASGSGATPWQTINHAIMTVPDGAVILVKPGTYTGRVQLDRVFAQGITVRSEVPYRAKLRNAGTVVTSYYGTGIAVEGFDIAHSGAGGALVIQIQDLIDGTDAVSRITIRNNVLHDSYDNDILKINNGADDILVEGNIFYNQSGSDEHIDINSVTDVVIRGNVFFNDFAGSGRTNANDTSSYIVIKDSNANTDGNLGSARITVERNVFLHWEGNAGSNFVLIGEDGTANYEAQQVTVENNLMLGDSANMMRAAFGVKGSRDITFRNNTIVGDLPANAFAMRLNREGANMAVADARFYNNVWADSAGTMMDFSDASAADVASFTLANNLYWNNGAALPNDATDSVNIASDATAKQGDPRLPAHTGLALPRWNETTFADGSTSTCAVLEKLVTQYGTPAAGSALIDAAAPANAPANDILGRPRTTPDLGAVETN